MSTSYVLEITTKLELNEVVGVLFNEQAHEQPYSYEERLVIKTENFRASIYTIVDVDSSTSICWGSIANFHIYFFNVDQSDENKGFRQILQLTMNWLEDTTDDMGLLYDGELPLLIRKNGNLIRNSAGDWHPKDLAILQIPHEVNDIPVC